MIERSGSKRWSCFRGRQVNIILLIALLRPAHIESIYNYGLFATTVITVSEAITVVDSVSLAARIVG